MQFITLKVNLNCLKGAIDVKTLDLNMSLKNKIKEYCLENDLNFNLLADMKKLWGIDMLKFERENSKDAKNEVVLEVFGYGDNVVFKQTEYTQKYLAK
nr:MAG TPA: hypothetical protein [Caudoviricetes sp.]